MPGCQITVLAPFGFGQCTLLDTSEPAVKRLERDMDNCDLEKLSVSGAELHPAFTPEVTDYKVTVESNVNKVTVDLLTSDCGASYSVVSTVLQGLSVFFFTW